MISFNFEYYKPETAPEAVETFLRLTGEGKNPMYYGGGTEIISMARVHNLTLGAVVDIKGIPECNVLEFNNGHLIIGAAVPLTEISESKLFPLLGKSGGRVADHTIQRKITLGGNLAGTIIYRETSLPLLLCDSQVVIAGPQGIRQAAFSEVFHQRLNLQPAEFLLQTVTDREYVELPYIHVKKTKQDKIDYPLLTVVAIVKDGHIRLAFSGLIAYPFRSRAVEDALNDRSLPINQRLDRVIACLPGTPLTDILGSAEYREFVLRDTLMNTLATLEVMG